MYETVGKGAFCSVKRVENEFIDTFPEELDAKEESKSIGDQTITSRSVIMHQTLAIKIYDKTQL
jgi:hypothetical protein